MSTKNTGIRRFYRDVDALSEIHARLKLTPCPHCGTTGSLIFNGKVYGYLEDSDTLVLRRQRVICNMRKACTRGCGKSVSLFSSGVAPYMQALVQTLWAFAELLIAGRRVHEAFKRLPTKIDIRAAYRWREKFQYAQASWRGLLCLHAAPPENPDVSCPVVSSLTLFQRYFPAHPQPFADYQLHFQRGLF